MSDPDELNADLNSALDGLREAYQKILKDVELRLITRIEEIEGRVPTNDEVRMHAVQAIHPDGHSEFKWKDVTIVILEPPTEANDWTCTIKG